MYGCVVASPKDWLAWLKKNWHNDTKLYFLQLPIDVMHLIFQEPPLYTKIFISQTCRSLRTLLRDDCTELVQSMTIISCLLRSFATHALSHGRVGIDFTAQPRVIEERFILFSRWEFKIRIQAVSMELY
jgi:hypothetical protein